MMKDEVENHADRILRVLSNKGKLSVKQVEELVSHNETVAHMCLGWLLKEDKISLSNTNGAIFVESKGILNEIYY